MNTIREFWLALHRALSAAYEEGEVRAIGRILLEEALALPHTTVLTMDKDTLLSVQNADALSAQIRRLAQGEPLQYVLGHTIFYGCRIEVAPGVLIPRPETEELIELMVQRSPIAEGGGTRRLLDVGTGSGCIPCALASVWGRMLEADALDYSPEALAIAQGNLQKHSAQTGARLSAVHANLFDCTRQTPSEPYDIIVSNPPYIHPDEAEQMTEQVLRHEPSTALFAPKDNPIAYYEAIALLAARGWLKPMGEIYLELNPLYADRTMQTMRSLLGERLSSSEVICDLSGKRRMAHLKMKA